MELSKKGFVLWIFFLRWKCHGTQEVFEWSAVWSVTALAALQGKLYSVLQGVRKKIWTCLSLPWRRMAALKIRHGCGSRTSSAAKQYLQLSLVMLVNFSNLGRREHWANQVSIALNCAAVLSHCRDRDLASDFHFQCHPSAMAFPLPTATSSLADEEPQMHCKYSYDYWTGAMSSY